MVSKFETYSSSILFLLPSIKNLFYNNISLDIFITAAIFTFYFQSVYLDESDTAIDKVGMTSMIMILTMDKKKQCMSLYE